MRQTITFTIDSAGKAEVIAHPCDTPADHRAAAEMSRLDAFRAETTNCKRVAKSKGEPVKQARRRA